MSNSKPQNTYSLQRKSFLITCWQEREHAGGKVKWRFNLETTLADKRHLFVNLQDVVAEIEKQLYQNTKPEE